MQKDKVDLSGRIFFISKKVNLSFFSKGKVMLQNLTKEDWGERVRSEKKKINTKVDERETREPNIKVFTKL